MRALSIWTFLTVAAFVLSPTPIGFAAEEAPTSGPTGGPLLPNARALPEGILSGGQPTQDQLQAAQEAGYKTVINLRTAEETTETAEEVGALGMTYVSIPIDGAAGLTQENAELFAGALETAERPAIVHCGSGNRAGALFALKAFYVDGATPEDALALGKAAGLRSLEAAVQSHFAEAGPTKAPTEPE